MTNLKQLFQLKKDSTNSTPQGSTAPNPPTAGDGNALQTNTASTSKRTYKQSGLMMAGACNGDINALPTQLGSTVTRIKAHQAQDRNLQEKLKNEIRIEIASQEGKIRGKEVLIKIHQNEIEQHQGDVSDIDKRIAYIQAHPEEFGTDPMSKVLLWISNFILLFLTVYLFVFYSSASYSAFFKEFTPDNNVITQAIFDTSALSEAAKMGTTALMFILLIPFIFLGLGFLIHIFQVGRNMAGYLKVAAVIVTTFIYDALLAYEITEKIYNIKSEGSFEESVEFSFSLAMTSVNFWVIIFSGFVVYIIWGFVFDSAMHSYQNLDKTQREIRQLTKLKNDHRERIASLKDIIHTAQIEQAGLRAAITTLQAKLNHAIIDIVSLSHELANFFDGWLIYITHHTHQNTADHVAVYEQFKKDNDIA